VRQQWWNRRSVAITTVAVPMLLTGTLAAGAPRTQERKYMREGSGVECVALLMRFDALA
jgi:hypothetical protein